MIGHNAGALDGRKLADFIERIEGLETDKRTIAEDIKNEYVAAKLAGFDVKTLRLLIRERRQDPAEREEQEALLEVYRRALGEFSNTPLGDAALRHVAGNVSVLPP